MAALVTLLMTDDVFCGNILEGCSADRFSFESSEQTRLAGRPVSSVSFGLGSDTDEPFVSVP